LEKTCCECNETKPLTEFPKQASNLTDGHNSWCRACHKIWRRKHYVKNREKFLKRRREKYRENPEKFHKQNRGRTSKLHHEAVVVLGGVCVYCGITDIRVLQIDHIHNNGMEERRKTSNTQIYRKIIKDPNSRENYQILCANCNWIKRRAFESYYQDLPSIS